MRKKIRYFILTSLLLVSFSSFGQVNDMVYENPKIDSLENKNLNLHIENLNFFKNNEFKSNKIRGYTLPGFRFSPKLSLVLDKKILIEAGFSVLKYWGANTYPCYSYTDIANWNANDYQKGFHFLPYFRAQVKIAKNLNFVFGNLYINNNHNLILPLYNPELNLSSDPETGLQLLFNSKYFSSDLWINWQSFMFKTDTHKEVFTFGFTSKTNIINPDNKLQVYIPIQYVAQHRGGELDSLPCNLLQTWSNYSAGIGFNYKLNKVVEYLNLELSYAGFKENAGSNSPFKNGYGAYSKFGIGGKGLNLDVSYWVCEDFMTILGAPQFINIATSTKNMVYDKMRVIYTHLDYVYMSKPNYSFGLEFNVIYYLPFVGHSSEFGTIHNPDYAEYSFGLFLKLNPKFKLYHFKD
ncbi:MAG: hypothetical protein WC135_04995 [Bacteroidales bacterium]